TLAMTYADLLKEYHISSKRGFVLEHPVTDLDDAKFREWRNLCKRITSGADVGTIRRSLNYIEDFDVDALTTHEEQRHAKLFLETIVQGYLYMDINAYEEEDLSKVPDRLPESLALPCMKLSQLLGMKPVISHASVSLANVKLIEGKDNEEFVAENLELIIPRTYMKDADTEGYSWFFRVTAEIEAGFAPAIHSIGSACYESIQGNSEIDLEESLTAIISSCEKARLGFKRYRVNLPPRVFYYEVRPCLWGYDQLPNGMKFGSSEEAVKYRGASASESTSMQVVDAFLNINYNPMQKGIIVANRSFMPAGHRKFIEYVEVGLFLIREISAQHRKCHLSIIEKAVAKDDNDNSLLHRIHSHPLFPSAMKSLKDLRSEHVNLVTLYVITQMKSGSESPVSPGKMLLGFIKSFRDACIVTEKSE
ncbi:hypothetical protein PRIPAC_85325, partial [Pristionchus pacificus]